MLRLTRQIYKYPLIVLILVGVSACSSGDSDNTDELVADDDDAAITSPADNPFDTSDQPAEPVPEDDDSEAGNESPEDSQAPVGASSDTSEIAGFWDVSQDTSEGNNVVHALIGLEGQLTEYDFQADGIGDGRDCYIIKNLQIASRGAEQYDIQNDSVLPGSQGSEDVFIRVEDGNIVFRFFALIPAPEGGNEMSPQTTEFPMSDLTPDDLEACE